MSKLKALKEKRAAIYQQLEGIRSAAPDRDLTPEERSQWDDLSGQYSTLDTEVEREQQFMDMERRQAEKTLDTGKKNSDEEEYRSAFVEYIRTGTVAELITKRAAMAGAMQRTAITPSSLSNKIEEAMKAYGGVMEVATILTTATGNDLVLPTMNDTTSKAKIVGENDTNTDKKAPEIGSITLKSYTYRTPAVPISYELLQDSSFDLDTLITSVLSKSFDRGVSEHLTTGTGIDQPKGIVTAATECATKAAAASIKFDDLLNLMKSVDVAYAANAKFMLNQNTLYELMKLKDTQGRYIWQDTVANAPATLFGKPYVLNNDMPDIGAAKSSILYGDLSKYYVRLVKDFNILRLNELFADNLCIGIKGFGRLDGNLIDAGTHPIYKLTHASA